MAGVHEKNNVAASAAEDNLAGSSRSGGPLRSENSYRWNPRDEPLVHEPAARQPPVLTYPPPTPDPRLFNPQQMRFLFQKKLQNSDVKANGRIVVPKREAESHFPVLVSKERGLWLHLDDMDYMQVWTVRFRFWPNERSRMYILDHTRSFIQTHGLDAGDTITLFKDDRLGSYLIRARRDAMRLLAHPTTHNPVQLPQRLPCDPLQDFGVNLYVVPRVLEYNHQTIENIAVNIGVTDASPSTNNQVSVQAEEDQRTTVHEHNNVEVAVAPVVEDRQTTVNENNDVGTAEVTDDHQTMMINANNYVSDNVNVANEMVFPSLDDHSSFKLPSLSPLFGSDISRSSYELGNPIDDFWNVGMGQMDFDFNFSSPK
ncbi:hypothetical protein ACFX2I_011835 [Malus domestica]